MTGHAGANLVCYPYSNLIGLYRSHKIWLSLIRQAPTQVPLVASNRVGNEIFTDSEITFYGGSFIADHKGAIVRQVRICHPTLTRIHEQGQSLASQFNLKGQFITNRLAKRLRESRLTLSRNASRAMLWPPLTSRISGGSVRGRCSMLG